MSRGQGRVYRRWNVWWLDYTVGRQRHREPTEAATKRDAHDILRERIGDRRSGKMIGRPERVVLAEYATGENGTKTLTGGLRWLHETQYDLDRLRSKVRVQQLWAHLEKFFGGGTRAIDITETRLDQYAKARLAEGAARQTVNNELSALRRGFNLARRKRLLAVAPFFDLPKVENTREGFFEEGAFAAVLLELPAYLRPVARLLRFVGWRVSEPLGLTWDMVDWEGQVIRLPSWLTKGKQGRLFPFAAAPAIKELLEAQWKDREGPYVFHREAGAVITYDAFQHQWAKAAKRAGSQERTIHDLRRTAARDMRRAGISEGEIQKLCGWKTRSMFDRYNIIDEADLASAVGKRYGTVTAQKGGSRRKGGNVSSSAAIGRARPNW